ncbi:GP100 [Caviid betaherpesvirus 2]|uniref:GP100 n=1 Tax=Guinea pig cytomegalovirus (strain 22122) TaxID=103920 RepID=B7TQ03_GPCMV|nr:GP100 [Caviid betaherpesvirus 2]AGE11571.1 GP100 [Caviid betaherpesvirus 2]AIL83959.1 GP100 [BAC cloning vector GPN13BACdenovo_preserved(MM)]BAJ78559.1 GP100 [Caviid betaherpesvirus 2]
MGLSHVDGVSTKTWAFSIACAFLSVLNVTVFLITANFPGLGFPCVYYHIVDYGQFNMTAFNVLHQITPQLFLDSGQIVAYVAFMQFVFILVTIYYVVCWIKINFRKDGSAVNQATIDIQYMGDGLTCFLFILTLDSFQLFILAMSFRLPAIISFTFAMHFIALTAFVVTLITQYQSFDRSTFMLNKLHPKLRGTVKFKTAVVNLLQMAMGFSTMVLSMTLCLGFGNSFLVRTSHMVFSTIIVFTLLACIYLIVLETVLIRYMKVQFGYHFGAFCGMCGALYPIIKYEAITHHEHETTVYVLVGLMFLSWLTLTLCRIIRFFILRHRPSYKPLPDPSEVKPLSSKLDIDE